MVFFNALFERTPLDVEAQLDCFGMSKYFCLKVNLHVK